MTKIKIGTIVEVFTVKEYRKFMVVNCVACTNCMFCGNSPCKYVALRSTDGIPQCLSLCEKELYNFVSRGILKVNNGVIKLK